MLHEKTECKNRYCQAGVWLEAAAAERRETSGPAAPPPSVAERFLVGIMASAGGREVKTKGSETHESRLDRSSSGGPFAKDVLFFSSSQWFAMGVVSRSKEEASRKGWLQVCVLTGWGYRPRPHARTFGTVCGTGGVAATAGGGRRPAGAGGQMGGGACVAGGVAERSSAAVGTWWHVGRFHGARPSAVGSPRWWARRAGI